jgi:hypothetical protein
MAEMKSPMQRNSGGVLGEKNDIIPVMGPAMDPSGSLKSRASHYVFFLEYGEDRAVQGFRSIDRRSN